MYEKLKSEYGRALKSADAAQTELSSLQSELGDVDKKITELEGRRSELVVSINKCSQERDSMLARSAELKKQLDSMVSDEEFVDSLRQLASEFVENCSYDELMELLTKLAPFQPVGTVTSFVNVTNDTVSAVMNGLQTPISLEDGGALSPLAKAVKEANKYLYMSKQPVFMQHTDVLDSVSVPFIKTDFVGVLMKALGNKLSKMSMSLDFGDWSIDVPAETFQLTNFVKGTTLTRRVEHVRMLYTFAFIAWMKHQGYHTSAESVLDYLIGVSYYMDGKVMLAEGSRDGKTLFYQLLSPDGDVVKETLSASNPEEVFVIYEDEAGYRVLTAATATVPCKKVCSSIFSCYMGGSPQRYRQPKCLKIDFRVIFENTKLTIKGVQ